MPIVPRSLELQAELTRIRRDIHAHPELAYEEHRTSDMVAAKLTEWGLEVHRGLGKTGVVGTLRKGNSPKAVGLRADMDALPMQETNDFEHRSTSTGRMHACGHDGHTTMLLGAARVMAETRNFEGAVHFIFQPAEEGGGGARAMIEDGLFQKFPCDAVFAIHNKPGLKLGTIATKPGPLLAAADRWDIRIKGHGGHAAHPHLARDPLVIGSQIVMALQGIVSRNTDPLDAAVVTVGFMKGGSAYNVIPGEMHIGGTTRTTTVENRAMVERRIREICAGAGAMHGVEVAVEYRPGYGPTINDADRAAFAADVAAEICGEANILRTVKPSMGAEDFSFMLNAVPGAMVWLGNGMSEQGLHNPGYDFNDQAIPFGVSFFVRAAERFLSKEA
ncbi:MAG: amidohydrolase [Alphaproteobacteria bacterium]|nr:amidohydrolase [Alphaproteobacteria bacterium]MCW5743033.1 amidohydrolase [Alphaproteobacteria bacterium]